MNIKQFLIEFKHIVSLHAGINCLREIILSLAFQGNLAQHSSEDASSLLRFLEEQRAKASKTIFDSQRSIPASKIESLFTIPEHWEWLPIRDIGHDWGQKVPNTDFTYIDVSSIDSKKGLIKEELTIIQSGQKVPSRARKIIQIGTVIYSTVRPYLLNIALVDREFDHEAIASTAFAIIHPWEGILAKYVYYYLRSAYFIAYVQSVQSGIAYPAINDKKFFSGLIPIPPTSEQKRIIAKVDELMTLCDKLEDQQQEREVLCRITRQAVLDDFTTAKSLEALAIVWNRLDNNFNLWLDNEDAVTELKDAVSFLGCCGFLTETNPFFITESNIRKVSLPTGWSWKTLDQLSEYVTSGSRGWKKYMASQGDIFIRSQDIKYDALIFEDRVFVNLSEQVEGMRTLVRPGDLLMTITGANVGKCAQVPQLNQKAYVK